MAARASFGARIPIVTKGGGGVDAAHGSVPFTHR